MNLSESSYCSVKNSSMCCMFSIHYCQGVYYRDVCKHQDLFNELRIYIETPVDVLAFVLASVIIMVSIFGKIEGTFKYCVINIAILHLLWPIFTRFVAETILENIFSKAIGTDQIVMDVINGAIGKYENIDRIIMSCPLSCSVLSFIHLVFFSRLVKIFKIC